MALPKTVGYVVVLLVICYNLENQGFRKSLNVIFQEFLSSKSSPIHTRERRETSLNSTDYEVQAVIGISDLERIQLILAALTFPFQIDNSTEITSIETTTVCSFNATGYQCICQESFAWSYNSCISHQACDAIVGDTCGCINGLPADDQYCQSNTSQTVTTPTTPATPTTPTPPNDPVDLEIVVDVRIPVSIVPSNFIDIFRRTLRGFSFPQNLSESLQLTAINFTTNCFPNSNGGLTCQCEEQFAWPCDKCDTYRSCSNTTTQTCDCIQGLPSDGTFCEPITNVTLCPTPTPVTTPTTPTTPATPTPPNDPVDLEIVVDVRIPVSIVPSNFIDIFRRTLRGFSFPQNLSESLQLTAINFTTNCFPNSNGGLTCQCEEQFAWPCDKCDTYRSCSNTTTQTCDCIQGLPSDGTFCEPITNVTLCPTPTPVTTPTTPTTPATPTPPNDPVDLEIVVDVRIPVSIVPSNFIDIFRRTLRGFSFPQNLSESLQLTAINFTTNCFPNSNGGLTCQCEEQFAWPCDKCDTYRSCKNTTTQTCDCIQGLPSDGTFCEPITNVTLCPTPTPELSTTPALTTTMTTTMNTTTPMTTTTTTINTTTPVTTTTTTMNTTTPMTTTTTTINTTTPVTTTTPAATPTTVTTPANVPVVNETLRLTLNIDFNPAFNSLSSPVYQSINNAIQTQSRTHIPNLLSAQIIRITSGSTIATYTVSAPSIEKPQTDALKNGLFKQLVAEYPIIFGSVTPLQFNPAEVFFNKSVTVTCGPPPADLNFGSNWTAEWRRNGELIRKDTGHSFSIQDGAAMLTVSRFFNTDNGLYECWLKRADRSIFRQKSDGAFKVKNTPLIRVRPVTQNVQCGTGNVKLQCSVNSPYEVEFRGIDFEGTGNEITAQFTVPADCTNEEMKFFCQTKTNPVFQKQITLKLSTDDFVCRDEVFGNGTLDFKAVAECDSNEVGEKTAVCKANGKFEDEQNNCVLQPIQDLLEQSEFLDNNSLPAFLDQLSNVTVNFTIEVTGSPPSINAIVRILNNIANTSSLISIAISATSMEDVLLTAGVLTTDEARESWDILNTNDTRQNSVTRSNSTSVESISSLLLQSLETITRRLTDGSFNIETPSILLNKTTFDNTFNADFNSSVEINITEPNGEDEAITVLTFASMDNVLPPRDEANSSLNVINGRVVLVQSSANISNISFTFDIRNNSLREPQCVFWNFSLFNGLGGWDNEGCILVSDDIETVTCNCNHLTSFSILMSPYSQDDEVSDIITYIGVAISMASLVICLIIEAVIWRKIRKNNTSYLRHVAIVNIAVSLLIANIWFIIGAAISDANEENPSACSAATFFIHFFYLALFFWMLASALLLLYRAVSVFDGGLSKTTMLAIGFCLGYGAPLIIAIITVAVTAPQGTYIRDNGVCWLNWEPSKALLAFVIPALLIVVINFVILLLVMYKMLRRRVVGDATQAGERHVLVVIARSLAVLTPFFGLTWGLGIGILIDPTNKGIHISFAFFNSLQGFFILVFGTLMDKKVRSEIAIKSQTSRSGTRSTSAGNSSSGLGFLWKRIRGRDGYNVSSGASSYNQSTTNT